MKKADLTRGYVLYNERNKAIDMSKSSLGKFCLIGLILLVGCRHNPDAPVPEVVSFGQTLNATIRSSTSALLSATVTAAPTGQALTAGFVWSKTNTLPTLADNKTAHNLTINSLPYSLSDSLTGLENKATYFPQRALRIVRWCRFRYKLLWLMSLPRR
jgi:hypothetical protein